MKTKSNILLIFITMYCLFPFYINGIYIFQASIIYAIAFSLLFYQLTNKQKKINTNNLVSVLFPIWLFLLLFIIVLFIHGSVDLSYTEQITSFVKQVVILFVPLFFLTYKKFDYISVIELYIKAVSLYIIFSFILYIPIFREFWLSVLYYSSSTQYELSTSPVYYSRFGLQGFSGFRPAILCSIAYIFSLYLMILKVSNSQKIGSLRFYLPIILIGCFIYGRIGIVSCIAVSIFTLFFMLLKLKKIKLFFSVFIFISVIVCYVFYNINVLASDYSALKWIFEPLLNFINNGELSSGSTSQLQSM
ncbi:hypothetical protein, partial [Psychrobacter sp. Ps6]